MLEMIVSQFATFAENRSIILVLTISILRFLEYWCLTMSAYPQVNLLAAETLQDVGRIIDRFNVFQAVLVYVVVCNRGVGGFICV
jgi:hypothetical protein